MATTLREADFSSCFAYPDVWMRPQTKSNGDKYWEYALVYVDDILVISHDPKSVMDHLSSKYTLKAGSVKETDVFGCSDQEMDYWWFWWPHQNAMGDVVWCICQTCCVWCWTWATRGWPILGNAYNNSNVKRILPWVGYHCRMGCATGKLLPGFDWSS